MTLHEALDLYEGKENTSLQQLERRYKGYIEDYQQLAANASSDHFKELYLIALANYKQAYKQIKKKESKELDEETLEKEISQILSSNERLYKQIEKEEIDFTELVKVADNAFKKGKYYTAAILYKKAKNINSENPYISYRLDECDVIIKDLEYIREEKEKEEQFHDILINAEKQHELNEQEDDLWVEENLLNGHSNSINNSRKTPGKDYFLNFDLDIKNYKRSKKAKKFKLSKKMEIALFIGFLVFSSIGLLTFSFQDEIKKQYNSMFKEKIKPKTFKDFKTAADELYDDGNYIKALIEYNKAIAFRPDNEEIANKIKVCNLLIKQSLATENEANILKGTSESNSEINENETNTELVQESNSSETIIVNNPIAIPSDTIIDRIIGNNQIEEFVQEENPQEEIVVGPTVVEEEPTEVIIAKNILNSQPDSLDTDPIQQLEEQNLLDSLKRSMDSIPEEIPSIAEIDPKNLDLKIADLPVEEEVKEELSKKLNEELEYSTKTFLAVDKRPQPEGGYRAFGKFVKENLKYPAKAKENKITGVVYVQFVVDKNGNVNEVTTTTNLGFGLEEEAVRLINIYPGWLPGELKGRQVNTQTSIPIWFN